MCFAQFIENNGVGIIAIFVTLAALGFSIFGTIYSNITQNIKMADVNASNNNDGRGKNDSKNKIHKRWTELSNHLRGQARRRAYSSNLCFWSLLTSIIALITYAVCSSEWTYSVILIIAAILLIIAVIIAWVPLKTEESNKRQDKKRCRFCRCFLRSLRVFCYIIGLPLWLLLGIFCCLENYPVNPEVEKLPLDC
jgi:Flp pilus assembly protein TadB